MKTNKQLENRAAWVAALRSGNYTQRKSNLQRPGEGAGHCCMGVGCEVMEQRGLPVHREDGRLVGPYLAQQGGHYRAVALALGVDVREEFALAQLNDSHGASFEIIADAIAQDSVFETSHELRKTKPEIDTEDKCYG